MTQPYKRCPQCGQPAVLEMPQCRRCGLIFAPPETAAVGIPPPATRNGALLPILLLLIALACGTVALLRPHHRRGYAPPVGMAYKLQPQSPPVGAAESGGSPGGGLFQETESNRELPTITVTNVETDTMTLVFISADGHTYTVTSANSQPASVQLPAGEYRLTISSDSPLVQENTGDALFRKFKQYTATFRHASDAGPVHLGDSQ